MKIIPRSWLTYPQAIYLSLKQHLFHNLSASGNSDNHPGNNTDSPLRLAEATARLLEIMDNGEDKLRQFAWSEMRQLSIEMRAVAADLPPPISDRPSGQGSGSGKFSLCSLPRYMTDISAFSSHQTALSAYLLPSSATLRILLNSEPPSSHNTDTSTLGPSDAIAIETLHTLSTFAAILDQTEGGPEGYHGVLLGVTDVLVATGGSAGVKNLLKRAPPAGDMTSAEGAWWMSFGESVVRYVDRWGFDTVLEPMIGKWVVVPFALFRHCSSSDLSATIQAHPALKQPTLSV